MAQQHATTDPQWLNEDEQTAWRLLLQMQTLLASRLNRDLLEHSGISDSDYTVLVALSEAPDRKLRSFELGRATQWEKSRLSHHLSRMEKRGLVIREDCPTDARGAFVAITDDGIRTIEAAAPHHVASVRRHFIDLLSPTELGTITSAATAVIASVTTPD